MQKEIQMFQISDKNEPVVGTEILDPNLPSNIDFQDQEENQHQKSFINPQKKNNLPEMSKIFVIGKQMKAFNIKGKMHKQYQPMQLFNNIVSHAVTTHPAKVLDQTGKGIKKIWESLIGYCKRQIMLQEGYIYFLERKGTDLHMAHYIPLSTLFKVFVDPEQQKVRLVTKQGTTFINYDILPVNFVHLMGMISQQLHSCGLALVQ